MVCKRVHVFQPELLAASSEIGVKPNEGDTHIQKQAVSYRWCVPAHRYRKPTNDSRSRRLVLNVLPGSALALDAEAKIAPLDEAGLFCVG